MAADGTSERRKKVTFVWNGDDTAAAYGSIFHKGPGAKFINLPMSLYDTFHADRIEASGKVVGLSTWTGYSANERGILSLGTIDAALATPGTEVTLVWGEDTPSSKAQVEDHVPVNIRATVMPAPLFEKARTVYRSDAGVK
jgi:syringate O-demethylase